MTETETVTPLGTHLRCPPDELETRHVAVLVFAFFGAVAAWYWVGVAQFDLPAERLIPLLSIAGTAYLLTAAMFGVVTTALAWDVVSAFATPE